MNYINYYQRNNAPYISFIFITKHVNNYFSVTILQGTKIQIVLFGDQLIYLTTICQGKHILHFQWIGETSKY